LPRGRDAFLSYVDAKGWARTQNLRTKTEFRNLGTRRPLNVPSDPNVFYRDCWCNWGDFLGTGRIATQKRCFRSYTEAQAWAIAHEVRKRDDWRSLDVSTTPVDVPMNPPQVYRSDWRGWKAFLRPTGIPLPRKFFLSFVKARDWAVASGVRSSTEWRERCADFPHNIPRNPALSYDEHWQGWGSFLGTHRIANMRRQFCSYAAASTWAYGAGIQTKEQWCALSRDDVPHDTPMAPSRTYRAEWVGWGSFLRMGRDVEQVYATYADAKAYAMAQGFTSCSAWRKQMRLKHPDDIPAWPERAYRTEWKGWGEFFGTGRIANQNRGQHYRSYEAAQTWARANGITTSTQWRSLGPERLPSDIPAKPGRVYAEWSNWQKFLGKRISGASVAEVILHHELSAFLPVAPRGRTLRLGGFKKRPDVVIPELKLVIEHDGAYWHRHKVDRDRDETLRFQEVGWRLVRLRELPLPIVSPENDLLISDSLSYQDLVFRVLDHLLFIGVIPVGLQSTIQKFKSLFDRVSQSRVVRLHGGGRCGLTLHGSDTRTMAGVTRAT